MKYAAGIKKLIAVCVVLVLPCFFLAAMDPVAGIMTGDGEVNAAGQMRGKYVQTALENFKRMIDVQNNAISQARDLNKKQVNKARSALQKLAERLGKIKDKN